MSRSRANGAASSCTTASLAAAGRPMRLHRRATTCGAHAGSRTAAATTSGRPSAPVVPSTVLVPASWRLGRAHPSGPRRSTNPSARARRFGDVVLRVRLRRCAVVHMGSVAEREQLEQLACEFSFGAALVFSRPSSQTSIAGRARRRRRDRRTSAAPPYNVRYCTYMSSASLTFCELVEKWSCQRNVTFSRTGRSAATMRCSHQATSGAALGRAACATAALRVPHRALAALSIRGAVEGRGCNRLGRLHPVRPGRRTPRRPRPRSHRLASASISSAAKPNPRAARGARPHCACPLPSSRDCTTRVTMRVRTCEFPGDDPMPACAR